MTNRYLVKTYVPCNVCGGSNKEIGTSRDGRYKWEEPCGACNEQGEIEVFVPIEEALEDYGLANLRYNLLGLIKVLRARVTELENETRDLRKRVGDSEESFTNHRKWAHRAS